MAHLRFKRFPPGWGGVRVPLRARADARLALSLYPACRPRAVWAQRAALAAVRVMGPRALPGRATVWQPPLDDDTWDALRARWKQEIGVFDGFAVYERSHAKQSGFAVLLMCTGEPLAFVKVRLDLDRLDREWNAVEAVRRFGPRAWLAPEPVARGDVDGVHYMAVTVIGAGRHCVPRGLELAPVLEDIEASLATLDRPAATPADWRPMHGDLTPWNLRRRHDGRLLLLDWEDASWGPPRADEVMYRLSAAVLAGRKPPSLDAPDAVLHWTAIVEARDGSGRDEGLRASMLDVLAGMRESAPASIATGSR